MYNFFCYSINNMDSLMNNVRKAAKDSVESLAQGKNACGITFECHSEAWDIPENLITCKICKRSVDTEYIEIELAFHDRNNVDDNQ